MKFSWLTFILEIINFLVLLWILKHFFYTPVRKIIIARQQSIQKNLDEAHAAQQRAEELQNKYKNRISDWEKEKEDKEIKLRQALQAEKTQQLDDLKSSLDAEKEKFAAQNKHQQEILMEQKEKDALSKSLRFITQLLKQFADENLESKIINFFVQEIKHLHPNRIDEIKKAISVDEIEVAIKSAFPLSDEQKNQICQALQETFAITKSKCSFSQQNDLISGVQIQIASMTLNANLKEELQLFAEAQTNA